MSKLPRSAVCPIHRSRYCCGRENQALEFKKNPQRKGPVTRIPDEHHPRGYRELCTPAEMRRRLDIKLKQQKGLCGICGLPITDYREAVPDHIEPRGMGGARRDDHTDNIQATHRLCNLEKGSKRTGVARN